MATATDTDVDEALEFVDLSAIPAITRQNGKANKRLTAFVDSGRPAAKINVPEGTKIESIASGLKAQAQKNHYPVKVFTRNGSVYLERIAADEVDAYWNDVEANRERRAAAKAAKSEG